MFKPYLGITGFTSSNEVAAALQALPSGRRRLMVGILVSDRTLEGLAEEMQPRRHPRIEDLPALFFEDPRAFNTVHFHTRTPEILAEQVLRLAERAGPGLQGVQINLDHAPADGLRAIRAARPDLRIILPLRGPVGRFLEESAGLADVVLYDFSAGRGVPFDPAEARAALEEIEAGMPGVALAVAGGLGPDTIHRVRPLLERFPDLSLDAESRLRDPEDRLDLERVREYLRFPLP